MVDNFDPIQKLFYFNEANNMFFHLQVLRRGKDHPELPAANKLIKSYLVRSREHLENLKEEVIFLCEHYKARAYINIAGKDFDKLNTLLLTKLANNIHQNNVVNPVHLLNSAVGELKSRRPSWIVDVDDLSEREEIKAYIGELTAEQTQYWLHTELPTKSGVHLITIPFNLAKFKEKFPHVDVHKNNPTILYIPKSLDG